MISQRNINRGNMEYMESLFAQYLKNPKSLQPEWQTFFSGVELASELSSPSFSAKELAVYQLIFSYREDGHLWADLNPLQVNQLSATRSRLLKQLGLQADLGKTFQISALLGLPSESKLKDIVAALEKTYCGKISIQVGGCQPEVREWFYREFEKEQHLQLSSDQKKNIFYDLARVEALERFLHSRFVGAKRFSIEGADVLIPMLGYLAEQSLPHATSTDKIREIVIGMAHRGRLNVLCNFLNKALDLIFMEFDNSKNLQALDMDGSVMYYWLIILVI